MKYYPSFYPTGIRSLHTWYRTASVKFELIRTTYKREVAFLVPRWCDKEMQRRTLRMLRVHNVQDFGFHCSATKMFKHEIIYNMYYSLMEYKEGIPKGESVYRDRDWSTWNKGEHLKQAVGYDLMIDVDAPNHHHLEEAYESAKSIKWYYDKNKIPYSLIFSGCGFHFITPHRYLPKKSLDPNTEENTYKWCYDFAMLLYDNFSEMVDTGIYDSRRICKIPYSLAFYNNDCFVCTPFNSPEQFKDFDYKDYRPETFKFNVRERATTIFNPLGDFKEVKV